MTVEEEVAWRALVVDDDVPLLKAHARALVKAGYQVTTALDGTAAVRALDGSEFNVILSDIDMPGMDGIKLLESVRERDLDVPVVFITGKPSVESAAKAMEYGALRYLVKPVGLQELVKVAGDAVRLHRLAKAKRGVLNLAGGSERLVGDLAGLVARFGSALESLYLAYQPIVSCEKRSVFGYEALLRSREPTLPHPGALIDAAEQLGKLHELGRTIRGRATEAIDALPDDVLMFLNLHPADLDDDELFNPHSRLAAVADRVVLEITERASLRKVPNVRAKVGALRALGYRIAIDDLGAGYAGLESFALLEPDVVKLDMSLIRNLDREPIKRTLVRTMVAMCDELGILVTAEGIETAAERDEVAEAGCHLMQGYWFARPGDAFPVPRFDDH
ncbi:MAG TPA: EAL domain-containing protein [Polyangiaceae bacterium]